MNLLIINYSIQVELEMIPILCNIQIYIPRSEEVRIYFQLFIRFGKVILKNVLELL